MSAPVLPPLRPFSALKATYSGIPFPAARFAQAETPSHWFSPHRRVGHRTTVSLSV
jgi:hypothetical protein